MGSEFPDPLDSDQQCLQQLTLRQQLGGHLAIPKRALLSRNVSAVAHSDEPSGHPTSSDGFALFRLTSGATRFRSAGQLVAFCERLGRDQVHDILRQQIEVDSQRVDAA
jgi:hypothetical protein